VASAQHYVRGFSNLIRPISLSTPLLLQVRAKPAEELRASRAATSMAVGQALTVETNPLKAGGGGKPPVASKGDRGGDDVGETYGVSMRRGTGSNSEVRNCLLSSDAPQWSDHAKHPERALEVPGMEMFGGNPLAVAVCADIASRLGFGCACANGFKVRAARRRAREVVPDDDAVARVLAELDEREFVAKQATMVGMRSAHAFIP